MFLICENLGIEKTEYNILERKNVLVEGNCDKKYFEAVSYTHLKQIEYCLFDIEKRKIK